MEQKINSIEKERINKLNKLIKNGFNPFCKNIFKKDDLNSLNDKYNDKTREELQQLNVETSIVGRIVSIRGPFYILQDPNGFLQAYVNKKESEKIATIIPLIDIGDIVLFQGNVIKTKTNNLTIKAKQVKMVTKSLKPLPEKWHGLKDIEERYRKRYLDLIVNSKTKNIFWTRTKIISYIRNYFDNLNYMEVETPILQPILGGAAAKPFSTYYNALSSDFYLRIATELPLKKLLVGGIERVYEIGRIFRNEGIDTTHNPEFTSIEFYESYSNLEGMMKRTEEVINFIAKKLNQQNITINDHKISFANSFKRIDMVDCVSKATNTDFRNISFAKALEIAKNNHIKVEKFFKVGHIINELFEKLCEKDIIQPTFVTGHPIEISPLASKKDDNPHFTERAELFIMGQEYANMFTELNDPFDQLSRFENQLKERQKGNEEANEIDFDFIQALKYGMPPAGGCGIGIDRLVMLFTNKSSIREVLLFPHLKNKGDL